MGVDLLDEIAKTTEKIRVRCAADLNTPARASEVAVLASHVGELAELVRDLRGKVMAGSRRRPGPADPASHDRQAPAGAARSGGSRPHGAGGIPSQDPAASAELGDAEDG